MAEVKLKLFEVTELDPLEGDEHLGKVIEVQLSTGKVLRGRQSNSSEWATLKRLANKALADVFGD